MGGYGPKLLQSIIYSFPSGTRFGAEVDYENNAEIDVFGSVGFVIQRNEQNSFFMTLISDYTDDDITAFKKDSKLRYEDNKHEIIQKLKKLKDKFTKLKQMSKEQNEMDEEDDEEIFIKKDDDEMEQK